LFLEHFDGESSPEAEGGDDGLFSFPSSMTEFPSTDFEKVKLLRYVR
jgi:hypothetical protein